MMEKMRMETPDLTSRNVDKLAELFPNCVTETRGEDGELKRAVNFDMLRQMLSGDIAEGDEAYEFTWVGKRAAMAEANRPIRKTLRPCPEESRDWDTTENLYIEGDNLEVLKLLQESYLGKVKMIYIDPPYNTGNDFVYRDDFAVGGKVYDVEAGAVDEDSEIRYFKNTDSNGRFHSDWCSMIYSRLMLARNLLTDDGFIAISIGEEEVQNLINICNEVFGEINFRNIIALRRYDKNLNLQFVSNGLPTMNVGLEYILVYSRLATAKMNPVYKKSSEERSQNGYWKGFWNNADRPTMRYEVLGVTPTDGQWKWKKEIADEAVQNYIEYQSNYSSIMTLEEYWIKTGKTKRFIRRNEGGKGKNAGVEHWVSPSDGILRNSNWSDLLISKPAGMDIPFDSPKNPDVITELIRLFDITDDIVLDFFSGSATTAHAVMQLNAEDGGHRRFIMVQLPEACDEQSEAFKAGYKNICEIGKERIRRAGDKLKGALLEDGTSIRSATEYKQKNGTLQGWSHAEWIEAPSVIQAKEEMANQLDIGFRVFKVDESNMCDVYFSAGEVTQQMLTGFESNIRDDRTALDLFFGCLLEWGLPLSMPYTSEKIDGCTVHTYNDGDLIACFDENVPESVIEAIAKRKPLRAVFRDACFVDSPSKINLSEKFKLYSPDTVIKVL